MSNLRRRIRTLESKSGNSTKCDFVLYGINPDGSVNSVMRLAHSDDMYDEGLTRKPDESEQEFQLRIDEYLEPKS